MFLAWKEIKYEKTRFALIIGVMVLVSYLVYFLTGLAYGLAQANRTSVDKWDADAVVLTDESNSNINMSMMTLKEAEEVSADETALLGQTAGVVRKEGTTGEAAKINVTFFGIDPDEFIMPEVIEGEVFTNDDEAIADSSLKDDDVEIGDVIELAGSDKKLTITGFTENAQFNTAPVLYTTIASYQEIRFEKADDSENGRISAVVVRDDASDLSDINIDNDDLKPYAIKDYINKIPSYNAQVLTFGLMIGFLVIIAAVVIGIFIYVLTLQKASMFGVMKAQGISSGYIAKSVIAQTFILSAIGVGIGLVLTIGTSFALPSAVPYQTDPLFLIGITGLLVLVAVLGALFSVRTVVNIDPLEAIG
ncbi:ABC transporter permease [Pisciglobus halotolerans]|uniref:Putative hemin transport system permease protein HrtB n=1 Tax=Pisciglobus halotolerans TaxID=745365 RepID=A0A1I3AQ64_9LACT|nr:ABC transporter permease [Pisciglobus halotolerans]SFH52080.1 putative ABC transport system permease protein [Pisciglobus halotolerans]